MTSASGRDKLLSISEVRARIEIHRIRFRINMRSLKKARTRIQTFNKKFRRSNKKGIQILRDQLKACNCFLLPISKIKTDLTKTLVRIRRKYRLSATFATLFLLCSEFFNILIQPKSVFLLKVGSGSRLGSLNLL